MEVCSPRRGFCCLGSTCHPAKLWSRHKWLQGDRAEDRAEKRLLLGVGGENPGTAECSGTVTKTVSAGKTVYPSATAEQAELPKHPCKPAEMKVHP